MSGPGASEAVGGPAAREGRVHLAADAALVMLVLFWGVSFTVVKDALGEADAFTFLTLRFTLGALALTALVRGRALAHLRSGAVLGVLLFLGFALQTTGLLSTTPSRSAFLTGLYVVFVPLLGLLLLRTLPRAWALLGVGLSALGLWLLTGQEVGEGPAFGQGEWLTLGCAVAYAAHILFTERLAPREGAAALAAVQLWVVALLSLGCLPFTSVRVAWTPALWGAVLFSGLFTSALAITVQTWAQARTSAVRATLIYAAEPVVAAAYSVALGRERLSLREWSGGLLILLGVLAAEVGPVVAERWRAARRQVGGIPRALP